MSKEVFKKDNKDNSALSDLGNLPEKKDAIILLTDVMFKKTDFKDLQERYPLTDFSDPYIMDDVKNNPLLNYENIEKGTVLKIDLFEKRLMPEQLIHRGHAVLCNYDKEINKIKEPEKFITEQEKIISEQNLKISELLKKLEGNNNDGKS